MTISMDDGVLLFLNFCRCKNLSETTIRTYRAVLRSNLKEIKTLDKLTLERVETIIRQLSTVKKALTVCQFVKTVRLFSLFLFRRKLIRNDISGDIQSYKVPITLPKAINPTIFERIIERIDTAMFLDRRDRAIICLLWATGIRAGEVPGLKFSDFDFKNMTLSVFGKGRKMRIVCINKLVRDSMMWYIPARKTQLGIEYGNDIIDRQMITDEMKNSNVFTTLRGHILHHCAVYDLVIRRAASAGFDGITPHVFRHTWATEMLNNGAPIEIVQALMGHSSIATTQGYYRLSMLRARTVFDACNPTIHKDLFGYPNLHYRNEIRKLFFQNSEKRLLTPS